MNLSSIVVAIILLSILVVVHEFGHFIVAKRSGVVVEEFAIGMGPKIVSHQFGETRYSLRLFPLGGFCSMLGEDGDNQEKGSFQSTSVWKRAAIVSAGPIMNFVLAVVFFFLLGSTSYITKPVIQNLSADLPAQEMGMQVGDKITKINGETVTLYQDIELIMAQADGSPMEIEVKRDGNALSYSLQPKFQEESGRYLIGFQPLVLNGIFSSDVDGYDKASVLDTVVYSWDSLVFNLRHMAEGFAKLFTFQISKKDIAGPIGIFQVVGEGYEEGLKYSIGAALQNLSYLGAILSVNLGLLNLLPIPALDGGRLLFIIVEILRRKPLNPELEGKVHMTGFMLLILFMIFIAFNDVTKIFNG